MTPSGSSDWSEHSSEVTPIPLAARGRRRFLKGIAVGSLVALGGSSVLIALYRQYIPLMIMSGAGSITALAWSPDGKYIASTTGVIPIDKYTVDPSSSETFQIWERDHGKLLLTYPQGIVSDTFQIWERDHKKPLPTYPQSMASSLVWSSDSKWLAWWDDSYQTFSLYEAKVEAASLSPIMRSMLFQLEPTSGGRSVVAFSPDGRWLAYGGEYSGQLSVCKISDGTVWIDEKLDGVTALAWSPSSQQLVIGGSDTSTGTARSQMTIMDIPSGKLLRQIPGNTLEKITRLAWSSDGHFIAAEYDRVTVNGGGFLSMLNAHDGQRVTSYQYIGWVQTVGWSPRNPHLLALITNSRAVQIWDLILDSVVATFHHGIGVNIEAAAWSPDGAYLATGGRDKRLCIWQVP